MKSKILLALVLVICVMLGGCNEKGETQSEQIKGTNFLRRDQRSYRLLEACSGICRLHARRGSKENGRWGDHYQ